MGKLVHLPKIRIWYGEQCSKTFKIMNINYVESNSMPQRISISLRFETIHSNCSLRKNIYFEFSALTFRLIIIITQPVRKAKAITPCVNWIVQWIVGKWLVASGLLATLNFIQLASRMVQPLAECISIWMNPFNGSLELRSILCLILFPVI